MQIQRGYYNEQKYCKKIEKENILLFTSPLFSLSLFKEASMYLSDRVSKAITDSIIKNHIFRGKQW